MPLGVRAFRGWVALLGLSLLASQTAPARDLAALHLLQTWEKQAYASHPELAQELVSLKWAALGKASGMTGLCAAFLTFDAFVFVPSIPRFVAGLEPAAQVIAAGAALAGGVWVVKEIYGASLLKLLQAPGREAVLSFFENTWQFEFMINAARGKRGATRDLYLAIQARFSNLDWPEDIEWVEVKLESWLKDLPSQPEQARRAPLDGFASWLWATR